MAEIKKDIKDNKNVEGKNDPRDWNFLNSILVAPVVSEKSQSIAKKENKYTFKVSKTANKYQIKKAVEDFYSVDVVSVNVLNRKGKRVRSGRNLGKRKNERYALVSVIKGKTIDIFK